MKTKTLLKNINKFYKKYDITHLDDPDATKLYIDDMYDLDYLMSAYESVYFSMEGYEETSKEYKWMKNLYMEISDYIDYLPYNKRPKYAADTIIKIIISVFGTMCFGAFVAIGIECGYLDWYVGFGMVFSSFLAFTSGMGAYEDIKWVKNND